MYKPESLRAHLLAAVPGLRQNPERLLIFIEEGTMRCTAAAGLSFEWGYTLNLTFTDYAGEPDVIAVALFAWLRVHQLELLQNLDQAKQAVRFEAELLSNKMVDLAVTLPLTERVIVKQGQGGELTIEHPPEPQLEEAYTAESWQLYAGGELLAEWNTPAP
jgi:hypothetical protein|tara:strand:- start:1174 stop:1656 length:483 start_codon:yes stop_codon:yes gene_type:complete